MKAITLAQAFAILENSAAVIIDNVVTYASLSDLVPDGESEAADNQFLHISWDDEDGTYDVIAAQGANQTVTVKGSVMTLTDIEGEAFDITILDVAKLD